ncbi:hypothetical protein ACU3L3_07570 [Priestia endophytica]
MNKLIVFPTYEAEHEFLLSPVGRVGDAATGSLHKGAGSIDTRGKKSFDLITFVHGDYWNGDYFKYMDAVEKFIKDLRLYNLTNDGTKFI